MCVLHSGACMTLITVFSLEYHVLAELVVAGFEVDAKGGHHHEDHPALTRLRVLHAPCWGGFKRRER